MCCIFDLKKWARKLSSYFHKSPNIDHQSLLDQQYDIESDVKVINIMEDNNLTQCSICLEQLDTDIIYAPCLHRYHDYCLFDWLSKSLNTDCPICRWNLSDFAMVYGIKKIPQKKPSQHIDHQNINYFVLNDSIIVDF